MKPLEDMNARELRDLIHTAEERLEVQTQTELQDIRPKIQALVDEAGVDLRELFRNKRRKKAEEPEPAEEVTV